MNYVLDDIDKLLVEDKYISKKDYKNILDKVRDKKDLIHNIEERITLHNNKFVSKKLEEYKIYFDDIFKKIDKDIVLDKEQRMSVLVDEDYCLVIAGAGAGKTTTVAAKVKYLVEKKNIKPEEIIVISYTNKAVKELNDRIVRQMNIPAKVTTFHALGYEILKKDTSNIPTVLENTYNEFSDILMKKIYKDKKVLEDLLLFLACYIQISEDYMKFDNLDEYIEDRKLRDYETFKSQLEKYNENMAKKMAKFTKTIKGEVLRSYQEVMIANFLYLNSIEYEYEKTYIHRIAEFNKPYQPDFYIRQGDNEAYIEHFGMYSKKRNNLISYKDMKIYENNMNKKIEYHRKYSTNLITTYYKYDDGKDLLTHLKEQLEEQGFILIRKNPKEVYEQIAASYKDKYISKLIFFVMKFIDKFKTLGKNINDFEEYKNKTKDTRTIMFLDLAKYVYTEYEKVLDKNNQIDFQDMINNSIEVIDNIKASDLNYKYIIVDEYQDIARQRFNLTKKLADVSGSKVIAVGDDWQSIFAFAGSSSDYFLEFKKNMSYAEELKITHTYRNSQELINIAGDFVQKNPSQIKKHLISNKHIKHPICIYGYNDDYDILNNKVKILIKAIDKIVNDYSEKSSILLISRYEFEKHQLITTGYFEHIRAKDKIKCLKYPNLNITILTAHKSKGLGFDNVILLNAQNNKYGFPSQIENDPIMKILDDQKKESIKYAEERRLFYVALTRTKNKIYIIAPKYNPSVFIQELCSNYDIQSDFTISNVNHDIKNIQCPICKFPLKCCSKKLDNKIDLWVCTNESELCDFKTNDKFVLKDIHYCSKCTGYMIVKKNNTDNSKFFGCTNYKKDGSGCSNTESI